MSDYIHMAVVAGVAAIQRLKLTDQSEMVFVIMHEIRHAQAKRNHQYNMAIDKIINDLLCRSGISSSMEDE